MSILVEGKFFRIKYLENDTHLISLFDEEGCILSFVGKTLLKESISLFKIISIEKDLLGSFKDSFPDIISLQEKHFPILIEYFSNFDYPKKVDKEFLTYLFYLFGQKLPTELVLHISSFFKKGEIKVILQKLEEMRNWRCVVM